MRDEQQRTGNPEDRFGANVGGARIAPGKRTLSQGLPSATSEPSSSGSFPFPISHGGFVDDILREDAPALRAGSWNADDSLMSALGLGTEGSPGGMRSVEGEAGSLRMGASGPAAAAAFSSSPTLPNSAPAASLTAAPATGAASSYRPEWPQVAQAASRDAAAIAALDIGWIDQLDKRFLDQIDSAFSEKNEAEALHLLLDKDPRVKAARKTFEDESKRAKTEATARLRASGTRGSREAYRQAPAYQAEMQGLKASRDRDVSDVTQELRPEFDAQRQPFKLGDSAVAPPAEGVTWKEGRTLTRVNFVAWGVAIFGSVDAFKAHFLGMRRIAGTSDLWMCAPAATRYEQARAWFEGQYPGNTFFSTSVGQSMRGLHQHQSPLGYLGHALGFSVDFAAYENPNQDDPVAQFMLRSFGGATDARGQRVQGDNNLDMPVGDSTAKIRAMGSASARGESLPAGSDRYLEEVRAAFDEMCETSDRFQASLRSELPALREAKQVWVKDLGPRNAALAGTEKQLASARKTARKKLQRGSREEVTAEMVDQSPAVAELVAKRDEQMAELQPLMERVLSTMTAVFAPWVDELQGEVDRRERLTSAEDRELAINAKDADTLLTKVKTARYQRDLTSLLRNPRFRAVFASIDPAAFPSEQALKEAMRARAEQVKNAKWEAGEIATRLELIRRLTKDPRAVFGATKLVKHDDGSASWEAPNSVKQPSVMQYLEKGFVKHDELAPPSESRNKKGVFNGEFVTAMMRWGFSTGASWGKADTMHFDFEDGYGMIHGNRGTKFGPKG